MRCAICGKEISETEFGKQYCYECEKRWLDDDGETIDLSYCFDNYGLFVKKEDNNHD